MENSSVQSSQVNPQVNQVSQDLRKPNSTKLPKKVIGVICVLLLIVISSVILVTQNKNSNTPQAATNSNTKSASSTGEQKEIPFYHMTIPALRSREYKSQLGELQEISNNGVYTSYLTNYESDGLRVNGLLTIPNDESGQARMTGIKYPAIVFVHGYIPPTLYVTTEKYVDYVDYLARNGFVVFKIDLRGHGESEGDPGGGYYGSDYVVDILNANAALVESDFVMKDAIGFWGHSMAGNAVMRAMAARPESPAGVIWAGAVYTYLDQRKYGINDNSYRPPTNDVQRQNRRRELFEKHGSPSAQSTFWQQVAPTSYLNDLKGAVEIHHAVDDDVVNVGYSRDLDILLDEAGIEHALYEYESGGHNISGGSFVTAMQRTADFFKKHLD